MTNQEDHVVQKLKAGNRVADHGGNQSLACRTAILSLLERALGQRIFHLQAAPIDTTQVD